MKDHTKEGKPEVPKTPPEYPSPSSALVKETEKLLLFSYLMGMESAGTSLDLAESDIKPIPFTEAVDFMKSRIPLTKKEWNGIEEKLRFRAFTVAALSNADSIERVRQGVIKAVEKGTPFSEFWEESRLISKAGLSEKNPWYWETVYRTNVQTAYNAGRAAQFKKVPMAYLEFVGIEDSRQTTICNTRSGVILPSSHPFWKSNWPPLHFNCRSTVRGVSREEVEVLREMGEDIEVSEEKELPRTPPKGGFGKDPLDSGSYYMMTKNMFERGLKYGIINKLNALDNIVMDFEKLWPGYKRVKAGKGWIDIHKVAAKEKEFEENYHVAKILAEDGHHLKMLPQYNHDNWKNPDYLMDGFLWELESPMKSNLNKISSIFREGIHQASRIILHLPEDTDLKVVKKAVFARISRKDFKRPFDEIILIANGKIVDKASSDYVRSVWGKI